MRTMLHRGAPFMHDDANNIACFVNDGLRTLKAFNENISAPFAGIMRLTTAETLTP